MKTLSKLLKALPIVGLIMFLSSLLQLNDNQVHSALLLPQTCATPPPGLVSWWPGDGNANDIAGSNHGTLQNGVTFAPGMVGQALSFDGIDDFIEIPENGTLDMNNNFTVEAWVRPEQLTNVLEAPVPIVSKYDFSQGWENVSYETSIHSNGRVQFGVTCGQTNMFQVTDNPVVSVGVFTHIATVYRSIPVPSLEIYVNGMLQPGTTQGSCSYINQNDIPFHIGMRRDSASTAFFKGQIDELSVYSQALSASEIQVIYSAGSSGKCKNNAPVAMCHNVPVSAGANCTANASINNGSFDPDGDTFTVTQSPPGPYSLGDTLVTLTVTDSKGASSQCAATVTVNNPSPTVTITGPPTGTIYPVGVSVYFNGAFTDNLGAHTANWMFGSVTLAGTVNESTGQVSATHSFTTPGVYKVKLTVDDGCGGTGVATTVGGLDAMVVIYDPDGRFVTGGGWINSPAGAYPANSSLTGKANFGFVSKYKQGAAVPMGQTEFQFKAAGLNFKSESYDWLVVADASAQYKGSGTINGGGNYGFLITAIDGKINGGGGVDKFRIKIWDKGTGDIVFDNQIGADDGAAPNTALGGGSIVIHK